MRKIRPELYERLETLVGAMGFELFGCELLSEGRQMAFRIYIEKADGADQKEVSIGDCSQVSHQVSALLDVEEPLQGHYTLEVSSPGIDRPLFELKHYQRYIGSRVKVKLYTPLNQRRNLKGLLKRVEGDEIYMLVDDSLEEVKVPFSNIEKANLIGEVSW